MYAKFAARDAVIVAAAVLLWRLLAERSAGDGALADLTGFIVGAVFGAAAGVLHEWGHVAGAVLTGSQLRVNHNLRSPFIFSFDTQTNSLAQFVVMSLAGFVVTAAIVYAAYVYLPDDLLATRVARGAAMFLAALGIFLELPLFLFAVVGRTVPSVAAVNVRGPVAR